MKLMTIVTPTYNQSEYLDDCIKSVLSAIDSTCEYIVVNDGSTDDTLSVMDKYKDNPQVKLINQSNKGQSATLNEQWSLSQAKYLTYLSSDDIVEKGAFVELINAIENRIDACAIYPDFIHFDSKGNYLRSVSNGEFDTSNLFENLVCQPGPCTIFKRDVLFEVGGWREDLRITPDLEFWMRVSQKGKIVRYPKALARYRVHPESQSTGRMSVESANEILEIPKLIGGYNLVFDINLNKTWAAAYLLAAKYNFKNNRYLRSISQRSFSLFFKIKSVF